MFARVSGATYGRFAFIRLNNDSAANYAQHQLNGNGATASGNASISLTFIEVIRCTGASTAAGIYAPAIVDILDYASANKYKTVRSLTGNDQNGHGSALFASGLWLSTAAINQIDITPQSSDTFAVGSVFALYGLRSA